jgi:hypothetical protein
VNNLQRSALKEYWENVSKESPTCDSDNSAFSTRTHTHSIFDLRRKYHENYVTPDQVKWHVQEFKGKLKMMEITSGT